MEPLQILLLLQCLFYQECLKKKFIILKSQVRIFDDKNKSYNKI